MQALVHMVAGFRVKDYSRLESSNLLFGYLNGPYTAYPYSKPSDRGPLLVCKEHLKVETQATLGEPLGFGVLGLVKA